MKKLNLNETIKVKLTDLGRDIYYHQYDDLILWMKKRGVPPSIAPIYPRTDENGYTEFQLWSFMELYGPYIGMAKPNVIDPLNIYIEDKVLEGV